MTLLAPERIMDAPMCSHSVRDGSSWSVGARVDGQFVWRTRQVDGGEDPECTAFEAACEDVIHLAGLTCTPRFCTTVDEAKQGFPSCTGGPR